MNGEAISVLFVDDTQGVRRLAEITLAKLGYRVTTANDGLAAITILRGEVFDVAIVDIIMPNKEGLSTIMEMKGLRPEMPVVAISGGGNLGADDLTQLGCIVGADRALSKPFNAGGLDALIRELVGATAVAA